MNQPDRRINLSGIHAMNWYGYTHDYIPVAGNLLLAGVMGSGKSILMDLIQHVVVGHQKSRYNVSATGASSGRTLKGYCLGDLKNEVGGITQFMRPRGAITLIALEFAWPGTTRRETWGFRIVFENATQPRPSRNDPFFVRAALGKQDLVSGNPPRPLSDAEFKELVATHDGRIFDTIEDYRRDMGNHVHLNFDRDTLDYLLPSAMSFTFLEGGFNRFCRQYILPNEPLKTDDVRESYLAFKKLEVDLREIRDKVTRLEQICSASEEWKAASADLLCFDLLQHEFAWKAACDSETENAGRIARMEKESSEAAEQLAAARVEKDNKDADRTRLLALFNATEDGAAFLILKVENKALVDEIARLKAIGTTVNEALQTRVRQTQLWLREARKASSEVEKKVFAAAEHACGSLAEAQPRQIKDRTRVLAGAMKAARDALESASRDSRARYSANLSEMRRLRAAIEALRSGVLVENSALLAALNRALPRREGQPAARALRQLCEVNDEHWRPALEVAFGQKFAVVVDETDYKEADKIFHDLKENVFPESLVIPARARKLAGQRKPGSLAEKLDTFNEIARRIVDHLLGDLMCVESRDELAAKEKAILPDGYMVRGAFNVRLRHYDYRPCIGERGLERQRGFLQDKFDEFKRDNDALQPGLDRVDALMTQFDQHRLNAESLHDDLAEAARLPEREQKLQSNMADLNRVRAAGFDDKERELAALDTRIAELQKAIEGLIGQAKLDQLEQARKLQTKLAEITSAAKQAFDRKVTEIGAKLVVARKDELGTALLEEFPSNEVCARECTRRYNDQNLKVATRWAELKSFRREMGDRYETMRDDPTYEIEAENNANYAQLLERLRVNDLEAVQAKAARERLNWQNLFRTTVAVKLNTALRRADDLIALMNTQLRRRIGNSEYQISKVENPDREYEQYRQLLAACAAAGENDLFASLEGAVRESVEALFESIVEHPDSRVALQFLDYRNYHDYDLKVRDVTDPTGAPVSIDRQATKMSGGENQSPYFIAILACYLRAYKRHLTGRVAGPSLCLIPIDEAFSKMSGDGIRHSIDALKELDLQGFLSMSSGNIPYAIDGCDQVLTVSKKKTHHHNQEGVRNIAVSLTREEALRRYCTR
jgi:uncharacterized protein YPO0396